MSQPLSEHHNPAAPGGSARATGAAPPARGDSSPTYPMILRHLARLRDGALAVLDLLEPHRPRTTGVATPPASPVGDVVGVPVHVDSPLHARIGRHMALVDRALGEIRGLNPGLKRRRELPADVRDSIARRERTIHDIVDAELNFWAATIEGSPLIRLDEAEELWVERILRLAGRLGTGAESREALGFLRDWRSNARH